MSPGSVDTMCTLPSFEPMSQSEASSHEKHKTYRHEVVNIHNSNRQSSNVQSPVETEKSLGPLTLLGPQLFLYTLRFHLVGSTGMRERRPKYRAVKELFKLLGNISMWEVGAGRSAVQCPPLLHIKVKVSWTT